MAVSLVELGIDRLTVAERLELIDQIWESIPDNLRPEDVPEWHKALLDKRLAEAEAHPGQGTPWREALASLRKERA